MTISRKRLDTITLSRTEQGLEQKDIRRFTFRKMTFKGMTIIRTIFRRLILSKMTLSIMYKTTFDTIALI